jgi:hypothetical protein
MLARHDFLKLSGIGVIEDVVMSDFMALFRYA